MSGPQRILITGSSGYLGAALIRALLAEDVVPPVTQIVGWDVRPPREEDPRVRFEHADVTDPGLADRMAQVAPDALVHLAFVLQPSHDEDRMYLVNVEGTRNVLAAAAAAAVPQVVVASSGTAYGAWPDNPVPLREDHPIRPHPTFQYAREKAWLEGDYQRFAAAHPQVRLAILRPCVVFGPRVNNYLSALLTALPLSVGLAGYDPPLQFVHEDDVAGILRAILTQRAAGAFNVAPPDTIPASEAIARPAKPRVMLPEWILGPVADLAWRLRLPLLNAPSSFLDYLRYPWVLDTTRVQTELGYTYQYSTRETLDIMLRHKGALR